MTRYRIPLTVSLVAVAGLVATALLDGSAWGPIVCAALLVLGLVGFAVALGTDPRRSQRLATVNHPAGLMTLAGVGLLVLGLVAPSAIQFPAGICGLLLSIVGPPAWMLRMSRAPLPDRPDARWRRLGALLLLAAPTVGLAIFVATAIATEGDLAWDGAPLALPGVIVAAFLAATTTKTFRRTPSRDA